MSTGILGTAFVVIGFVAMVLMFHLWGYPFDKATKTSSAPKRWMLVHRLLGYAFAVLYVALMIRMVPRLWQYQVEFPARTAIHIVVGFTVGFLLLIKIMIMRFFRHFEEWMPVLGVSIMLGTVILTGLSLPFLAQARTTSSEVDGARVALLLPSAGLPKNAPLALLSTQRSLESGRDVLLEKCAKCHDLKTILAKPRTPSGWWDVVERMADKPALFTPMTEQDLFEVTGYLIAITPDLQKATKRKREDAKARDAEIAGMDDPSGAGNADLSNPFDSSGSGSTGNVGSSSGTGTGTSQNGSAGGNAGSSSGMGMGTGTSQNGAAGGSSVGSAGGNAGSSSGMGMGTGMGTSQNGAGSAGSTGSNTSSAGSAGGNASSAGSTGSGTAAGSGRSPGTADPCAGTSSARSGATPCGTSSTVGTTGTKPVIDLKRAKVVYTDACAQCHDLSDVDAKPPRSAAQVKALIQRMIKENEASFTTDQIKLSTAYMIAHFVDKTAP